VVELLRAGLDLGGRHVAGTISRDGLAVARGRVENQLSDLIFPRKANTANEPPLSTSGVRFAEEPRDEAYGTVAVFLDL
jgi:hypothetical protein